MKNRIQIIDQNRASEIIDNYVHSNNEGLFLVKQADGTFTAIDNTTGDAWAENFRHEQTARWWLHRLFEDIEDAHRHDLRLDEFVWSIGG